MKRERIIIDLPAGATATQWTRALDVARTFASEHIDRRSGQPHGASYRYDDGDVYAVWWTHARAVSVWYGVVWARIEDGGQAEIAAGAALQVGVEWRCLMSDRYAEGALVRVLAAEPFDGVVLFDGPDGIAVAAADRDGTRCGIWPRSVVVPRSPAGEYRDPRANPRPDDILRVDDVAVQVVDVDHEGGWVEARDITGAEWGRHITQWRVLARNAAVLWQEDAPPPADAAALAAANRALAARAERAELERDEARRVLLAVADAIDDAATHEFEGSLSDIARRIARAVGGPGLWTLADAIRKLCGASDG